MGLDYQVPNGQILRSIRTSPYAGGGIPQRAYLHRHLPKYIMYLEYNYFLKVTWEHLSSRWQKISSKCSAQAHILTVLPCFQYAVQYFI